MGKHRINLMIMRDDETNSAVRSYSLPGYLPRLAIILGVVIVILMTLAGASVVYFWQAAQDAKALRVENEAMRRLVSRLSELESELEQHREFTRRIAGMIGVELPGLSDSASGPEIPGYAVSEMDSESAIQEFPAQAPLGAGQPGIGVLVTECAPDPNNRPRGLPVHGRISRGYMPSANNPGLRHRGIDIATREGTPVYAPATGVVVYAGQDDVLGLMLTVDHGGGFKTIYGHNSRLNVRIGDKVSRGEVIALTGNTGESTAPHLHYEIRRDGHAVDPAGFLGR